jgi:hypothetical protein
VTDLAIARAMHWTYDEVGALDADVYAVLVEELQRELKAAAR